MLNDTKRDYFWKCWCQI